MEAGITSHFLHMGDEDHFSLANRLFEDDSFLTQVAEFVKQSRKYHKVLMESGIKVHFIHLADEDHLSVSQVLSDEDSFLIKASRHMHLHVCLLRV
jgi:hypothetical protein